MQGLASLATFARRAPVLSRSIAQPITLLHSTLPSFGSSAPSAAWTLLNSSSSSSQTSSFPSSSFGSRRNFTTSRPALGMEEFFPLPLKEGEVPQRAGRAWSAAELRLKSWEDLHKLWFVCLKERNVLLTERLYFRQISQSAPEASRMAKVRKTMAMIKVVIGERARAEVALNADKERVAKAEKVGNTLASALGLDAPPAGSGSSSSKPVSEMSVTEKKAAAAKSVKDRLKNITVTYKKFGRKYTVPAELAPTTPTRAEIKRIKGTGIYLKNAAKMMNAPPIPAAPSAAYLFATQGKNMRTHKQEVVADRLKNAGLLKKSVGSASGEGTTASVSA